MIKIRCVVERITYQNPENGYSVLKCAVKNYNDLVTVVGNLVDVNVGSVLLIDGNWKVDAKYGRQFLAESWEETMPATVFGIEKYLGSGLIKGVGPKFAKKIVQQFGTDTLEIIETDVKRLLEVPGIGKKRVDKIAESWERQNEIKNVMLFLQDHGVSTAFAAKIYRQVKPEECLVFEDAVSGIQSAYRAGIGKIIAIDPSGTFTELLRDLPGVCGIIQNFDEFDRNLLL